jgi:hypothetical protein
MNGDKFLILTDEKSFPFDQFADLASLGLLIDDLPGYELTKRQGELLWCYFSQAFHAMIEYPVTFLVGRLLLTRAGRELSQIAAINPDARYLDRALAHLRKKGLPLTKVEITKLGGMDGIWRYRAHDQSPESQITEPSAPATIERFKGLTTSDAGIGGQEGGTETDGRIDDLESKIKEMNSSEHLQHLLNSGKIIIDGGTFG